MATAEAADSRVTTALVVDGASDRARYGSPVLDHLAGLIEEYRDLDEGAVATYIPELAKANPGWFGIAVVTTDGHVYEVGDSSVEFTIQSISKPFVFGMALEEHGRDAVLARVGVEPSGNPFNAIVVDDRNRPFNPMVNAGAIVATGLVAGPEPGSTIERITRTLGAYAGRPLELDAAVYESERATGDRNRSIAYLMRSFGALDGDVAEVIDAYFRQCSLLVSSRDLATMAATLANRGVNPVTGERALDPRFVENVLAVMGTCGMYDYAGEWAYTVGLPAKSGVAGGVIAVLPGQLGIGVFSPRLDPRGNSARGIRVCQRLAADYDLHPLRFQPEVRGAVRRTYRGAQTRSARVRPGVHHDVLGACGDGVVVYELQGDLFFSGAERLFRTVVADLAPGDRVVLDCRRLGTVDRAAVGMLERLYGTIDELGGAVVFADVAHVPDIVPTGASVHDDVDAALEWCEDALLEELGIPADAAVGDLRDQELLAGLTDGEVRAIEHVVEVVTFAPGDVVFREGDPSDAVYFLLAGSVRIRLLLDGGTRERRLATFGPGVAFGEMALLEDGVRSADVVTEQPARVARLALDAFQALAGTHPGLETKLARNLARNLADRLRRANDQVRLLAS